MPASFRLVEPTDLYSSGTGAVQDSLTDVRHDGLVNLIRQMASLQRHAADIFAGVAEEILLIDARCGRLTERIGELDARADALPNPIKTKISTSSLPFFHSAEIASFTYNMYTAPASSTRSLCLMRVRPR